MLLLESYAPEQLRFATGGPKDLDMLLDINTVKAELAGLEFIVCRSQERVVMEGEFHNGQAAVTQVIAIKSADR